MSAKNIYVDINGFVFLLVLLRDSICKVSYISDYIFLLTSYLLLKCSYTQLVYQ